MNSDAYEFNSLNDNIEYLVGNHNRIYNTMRRQMTQLITAEETFLHNRLYNAPHRRQATQLIRTRETGQSLHNIELNTLETKYKQAEKEKDCSICLTKFQINEEIRRLPCLHIFHKKCIDQWLSNKRNCPYCRFEISNG